MAAMHATTSSILSSFLPRLAPAQVTIASRSAALYSRQLSHPLFPPLAIPSAIHLNIPGLLESIWESILKAVPKKKTSYQKKRSRFMAGKALKDVTNLNRCSVCGHVKRAHLLCPYCVDEVKRFFRDAQREQETEDSAAAQMIEAEKMLAKKKAYERNIANEEANIIRRRENKEQREVRRAEKEAIKAQKREEYEQRMSKGREEWASRMNTER